MKINRIFICAAAAALSAVLSASPVLGACGRYNTWNSCKNFSYSKTNSCSRYWYGYNDVQKDSIFNFLIEYRDKLYGSFENCTDKTENQFNDNSSNTENSDSCTGNNCSDNENQSPVKPNENQSSTGDSCENNSENKENSSSKDEAVSDEAAEVLNLVNKYRAENGLSSLKMNQKALKAANVRAEEISRSFSHTRPNGSSFSTALDAVGITNGTRGENIANGYKTPSAVMTAWMNSQGHRANILNSAYDEIGIGVYKDASGRLNWVQLFIG